MGLPQPPLGESPNTVHHHATNQPTTVQGPLASQALQRSLQPTSSMRTQPVHACTCLVFMSGTMARVHVWCHGSYLMSGTMASISCLVP
mmetsp:Transcript_12474/g.26897  ORF Transcript_12474/g.26897 Transcript_12474/m.26897 type:complete len:89 (+) Transcript_12474:1318-1584(+)